jgi:hypothetical protein
MENCGAPYSGRTIQVQLRKAYKVTPNGFDPPPLVLSALQCTSGGTEAIGYGLTECHHGGLRINLYFCRYDLDGKLNEVAREWLVDAHDIGRSPFRFQPRATERGDLSDLIEIVLQPFSERLMELGFLNLDPGGSSLFCAPKLSSFVPGFSDGSEKTSARFRDFGNIVSRFHTEPCTVFLGVSGFCWEIFSTRAL